jgi:hypothetical protein
VFGTKGTKIIFTQYTVPVSLMVLKIIKPIIVTLRIHLQNVYISKPTMTLWTQAKLPHSQQWSSEHTRRLPKSLTVGHQTDGGINYSSSRIGAGLKAWTLQQQQLMTMMMINTIKVYAAFLPTKARRPRENLYASDFFSRLFRVSKHLQIITYCIFNGLRPLEHWGLPS